MFEDDAPLIVMESSSDGDTAQYKHCEAERVYCGDTNAKMRKEPATPSTVLDVD